MKQGRIAHVTGPLQHGVANSFIFLKNKRLSRAYHFILAVHLSWVNYFETSPPTGSCLLVLSVCDHQFSMQSPDAGDIAAVIQPVCRLFLQPLKILLTSPFAKTLWCRQKPWGGRRRHKTQECHRNLLLDLRY